MPEWTELPECPYCGDKLHDWWDGLGLEDDGDEIEIECGNCEETYIIRMSVDVSFSTIPIKGVENADPKPKP